MESYGRIRLDVYRILNREYSITSEKYTIYDIRNVKDWIYKDTRLPSCI